MQLKQSLVGQPFATQEAMLAPTAASVQASTDSVHNAAAQGVQSGGSALPYAPAIQAAFGRHDVSNVQAHTDGGAKAACGAIGAEAYATGDHVAFSGAPSLHTAAHEATHVIQQRHGVALAGGVGQSGDAYERQADRVADRVVSGGSATELLDQVSGSAGAVQKLENASPPPAAASVGKAPVQAKAVQLDEAAPTNTDILSHNNTTLPSFLVEELAFYAEVNDHLDNFTEARMKQPWRLRSYFSSVSSIKALMTKFLGNALSGKNNGMLDLDTATKLASTAGKASPGIFAMVVEDKNGDQKSFMLTGGRSYAFHLSLLKKIQGGSTIAEVKTWLGENKKKENAEKERKETAEAAAEVAGPDVGTDYDAFDNDIQIADNYVSHTYLSSADAQVKTLLNARFEAARRFEAYRQLKDGTDFWAELGKSAFWTAIGMIPAAGPVAKRIKAVAGDGTFYAEGLKTAVGFLTKDLPQLGLAYKGADSPGALPAGDATSMLTGIIDSFAHEEKVWGNLVEHTRKRFAKNKSSAKPEPWTLKMEALAKRDFKPIAKVDMDAAVKVFEELTWKDYLGSSVESDVQGYIFKDSTYIFDSNALSRATADYLRKRFGWSYGDISAKCRSGGSWPIWRDSWEVEVGS